MVADPVPETPEYYLEQARWRINSSYIKNEFDTRVNEVYYSSWKDQTSNDDMIYRGEWPKVFGEEKLKTEKISPQIMNVAMAFVDDVCRLVAETRPTLRCAQRGDGEKAVTRARVEEVVGMTYWDEAEAEEIEPDIAGDIAMTGTAFLGAKVISTSDYPVPWRFDPRGCYPSWSNKELIDLMIVSEITYEQARYQYGPVFTTQWDVNRWGQRSVHIVEFYNIDEVCTVAIARDDEDKAAEAFFLAHQANPLADQRMLPVVGVRRSTGDGRMRGMISQVGGKLRVSNRLMTLFLDALDQAVYAQVVQRDTDYEQVKGNLEKPITLANEQSSISRLQAAASDPQVLGAMQFVMEQVRGELGYPAQRQGDAGVSIGSAAYMNSSMSQLTTEVRDIGRMSGRLRGRWTNLAYQVDKMKLDFEKPLMRSVGNVSMYTPTKDLGERPRAKVTFGSTAGLDPVNQTTLLYQGLQYRVLSREDVMEQMPGANDPEQTKLRLDKEMWHDAMTQQALQQQSFTFDEFMAVDELLSQGIPLDKALQQVREQLQAAMQKNAAMQQGGGPPEGAEGEPGGNVIPMTGQSPAPTQQTALQKGAMPGGAENVLPPPPGPLPPGPLSAA